MTSSLRTEQAVYPARHFKRARSKCCDNFAHGSAIASC
jgi:hypothetical protein